MSGKELTFSSEVGGGVLDSSLDCDTLSLDTHTHTPFTARVVTTGCLGTVKGNSFRLDCPVDLCID